MDINTYLEQTYQWMQTLYIPEKLDSLVKWVIGWLEGMTPERAGALVLWTVIVGVILDLVLYWTRKDQMHLLRRVWNACMRLWDKMTAGQRRDSAAE